MKKITDQHKEYSAMVDKWQRCRDFISGADALREHDLNCYGDYREAYLPLLSDRQLQSDYERYVRRALYDNGIKRMRNSLKGLIFSKEPEVELSPAVDYMEDDCDLMETPLIEMAEWIVQQVLDVGRCGILVDRPSMSPGLSLADAEKLGLRAHFVQYTAEQIINWEMARVGSRWMTVRVVLCENEDKYTELLLDDIGYCIVVWHKEKDEWKVDPPVYPQSKGSVMQSIPFWFFGATSGKPTIEQPPLLDMVEDARSWYQSSADLEHARFACGLPTPGFYGFSEEEAGAIMLGGQYGIHSTNTDARAEYLEYKGEGTMPLERALEQKSAMMARHGVDIIDKADAEATDTIRARVDIQTATLSSMANCVSRLLEQALDFASEWMAGGECEFELSTKYIDVSISPQEITALLQAVVQGALSQTDFVHRLRKGGIIEADRTDEDIQADLDLENEKDAGNLPQVNPLMNQPINKPVVGNLQE